jgi:hypothetical protein
MKKILLLGIVGLFCTVAIAQNTSQVKRHPLPLAVYGDNLDSPLTQKERGFILEVYGDYAQKYVFDNPQRLKDLKNLLRNRVVIEKNEQLRKKKDVVKLSSMPLFNSYVPDLTRDSNFNPNSFNPLKYNLEFFSNEAKLYVVDGSDYIILIKSQYQK